MSEASCLKAQITEHRHRGPSEQQHQGFFFIVPLAGFLFLFNCCINLLSIKTYIYDCVAVLGVPHCSHLHCGSHNIPLTKAQLLCF